MVKAVMETLFFAVHETGHGYLPFQTDAFQHFFNAGIFLDVEIDPVFRIIAGDSDLAVQSAVKFDVDPDGCLGSKQSIHPFSCWGYPQTG